MDDKKPEPYPLVKSYHFVDKAIPSPPGKKVKHLIPAEDAYAMNRRWWLVTAGAAVAALAVGMAVGRFLLP
jgi:hypothetical protein